MHTVAHTQDQSCSQPASAGRVFVGVVALLFIVSAAATVVCCLSMTAMQGMVMPGGWSLSMLWIRMPGQTWLGAMSSFLAMWIVMMVAMMLPSALPGLLLSRQAIAVSNVMHEAWLTVIVGLAYFSVWTVFGLVIFPVGVLVVLIAMKFSVIARAVPIIVSLCTLIAGFSQLTAWKARQLDCCREVTGCRDIMPLGSFSALRYGIQLGLHCCFCCANLTFLLLVNGMMDLRIMLVVTVAITMERLLPSGQRIAHVLGVIIILVGTQMLAKTFVNFYV